MKVYQETLIGAIGGAVYVLLELAWRGRSHWTMFLLGGLCFWLIGGMNRHHAMPLLMQACLGAVVVTVLEFGTGMIVNRMLGWNVWDYSALPCNLLGQVCLYFFVLWIPLSAVAAVTEDRLRHWLFSVPLPQQSVFFWQ